MSAKVKVLVHPRGRATVLCLYHIPVLRLSGRLYPTTESLSAFHGCWRCYDELSRRDPSALC